VRPACGQPEVAGSPQFTHISEDDFRVVRDNLLGGSHLTTGRQVTFCLFTDTEFVCIGMSEKGAKAKGIAYRLFKVLMAAVLRAQLDENPQVSEEPR
jgi:pyruvate/2-oxoglutarate dehydrogenase complex dihydrolipoamide dehydrogenase (E3) component